MLRMYSIGYTNSFKCVHLLVCSTIVHVFASYRTTADSFGAHSHHGAVLLLKQSASLPVAAQLERHVLAVQVVLDMV
jgi:hypothetical protein